MASSREAFGAYTAKSGPRKGKGFNVVHRGGVRYHKYASGKLVADKEAGSSTVKPEGTVTPQSTGVAKPSPSSNRSSVIREVMGMKPNQKKKRGRLSGYNKPSSLRVGLTGKKGPAKSGKVF